MENSHFGQAGEKGLSEETTLKLKDILMWNDKGPSI